MASVLCSTISGMPGGQVVAVMSASRHRARGFATEHRIGAAYTSVGELASDPDVEFIYIASTNDRHYQDTLACLEKDRPVLIEKPFALDRRQATEMVERARKRGIFLMEGMWMRFQPAILKLADLVAAGTIGPVRHLAADFVIPAPDDPNRRWFSPELGGGSVYDLGVYPLALAHMLLGPPVRMTSLSVLAKTGVETQSGMTLAYAGGELAVLSSSLLAFGENEAVIAGPEGRITLRAPFHHSTRLTVHRRDGEMAVHDVEDLGYRPEVEEVERCVTAGKTESDLWSLDDSLALMDMVDRVHAQSRVKVLYSDPVPNSMTE